MKLTTAIFGTLVSLSSWAQTPPDDSAHFEAHRAYLGDLADALAQSSDPRDLMIAARFKVGVRVMEKVRHDPEGLARSGIGDDPEIDALVRTALSSDPDDPLVWWIAATNCPGSAVACDAPRAVARLRQLDPENAVVWLVSDRAQTRSGPTPNIPASDDDERLLRIASASRYDTYLREDMHALDAVFASTPMPDMVVPWSSDWGPAPATDLLRFALAQGHALAGAFFGYSETEKLCGSLAQTTAEAARRDLCGGALRFVLEHADALAAHQVAAGQLHKLLPPGAEREAVAQKRRHVSWQLSAWGELQQSELAEDARPFDVDELEFMRDAWNQPGANELSVMRARLEAAGISLEPPAAWEDPGRSDSGH